MAPNVKRNVIYNVLGGVWSIALNLVLVRVQLQTLGAEAYGLISFGQTLMLMNTLFDFGLSTTLIRSLAAEREKALAFVRSAAALYWLCALIIGALIFFAAEPLALSWLRLEQVAPDEAVAALRLWAIAIAFNHLMYLYVALLSGAQRLDLLNAVKVLYISLYQGGGALLLAATGDLLGFMTWNALTSVIGAVFYSLSARRAWRPLLSLPRLAWSAVRPMVSQMLSVYGTVILSLILIQVDRLFISRLLPLTQLGFYNTAFIVIQGIGTLQGFLSTALLPALASDHGAADHEAFIRHMRRLLQAMLYVIAPLVFACIAFGREILLLWTTSGAADGAFRAMALLALGSLLNTISAADYTAATATANADVIVRVNLWLTAPYVALMYAMIVALGIEGAALTWIALNFVYLFTQQPAVHRRLFGAYRLSWTARNAAPFVLLNALIFGVARLLHDALPNDALIVSLSLMAAALALSLIACSALLDADLRQVGVRLLGRAMPSNSRIA
ncbi:MAG: oligosaccharide flippase family protein [Anaerolineae bacterium]|nr:oligosaccharide flippase family protein [Anaerolineae bacterium]